MPELGFRQKRFERRRRLILLGVGVLGIFAVGYGAGFATHSLTSSTPEGQTPVACVTLAVIPADVVPKPSEVKITVLNGSARVGMAGITADVLKDRGFKIASVGNFEGDSVKDPAEIHYGPKGVLIARLLSAYVPDAYLVEDSRDNKSVEIIIGQGFDRILNKEQAARELQRPYASPSGPAC